MKSLKGKIRMTDNWSNAWVQPNPVTPPKPTDPRDIMSQDDLLMLHLNMRNQLAELKEKELDLRKYIVNRAFPVKQEGTNTVELGKGYTLKAVVKYNYKLDSDNDKVWAALDDISKMGNEGPFFAERLIKWEASFLLTEYRNLCKDDATEIQKKIRKRIEDVLTITDAAPTLEVRGSTSKK